MSGPQTEKRDDRTELLLEGQRRSWLLRTAVDDVGVTPLTLNVSMS